VSRNISPAGAILAGRFAVCAIHARGREALLWNTTPETIKASAGKSDRGFVISKRDYLT
jgi:hypothetical protein